jgi:hypothetical protein
MNKHLAAIEAGSVTRSNIIGIRKAMNANERRSRGYSTGRTCPKITFEECDAIRDAIGRFKPRVDGQLHDSGMKLLRSPRYRKRLENVAQIIAEMDHFDLVSWEIVNNSHWHPIYRAVATNGDYFDFLNIPWQSGGNGPEVL